MRSRLLRGSDDKRRRIQTVVIPALKKAAPKAKIVLVGYPRVMPKAGVALKNCGAFSDSERRAINKYIGNINKAWWTAAFIAGADFIDVTDALDGHELCTDDSHMVSIYGNPSNSQQGHPNASGQDDISRFVLAGLKNLGYISQ